MSVHERQARENSQVAKFRKADLRKITKEKWIHKNQKEKKCEAGEKVAYLSFLMIRRRHNLSVLLRQSCGVWQESPECRNKTAQPASHTQDFPK